MHKRTGLPRGLPVYTSSFTERHPVSLPERSALLRCYERFLLVSFTAVILVAFYSRHRRAGHRTS